MSDKNSLIRDIILYFFPILPIFFLFLIISIGGVGLVSYLMQFGPCFLIMIIAVLFNLKLKKPYQKIIIFFITLTMLIFYLQFLLNAMAGGLSMAVVDGGHTDWISRYKSYAIGALSETLYMSIFILPYVTFMVWLDKYGIRNLFKWLIGKLKKKCS